MTFSFEKCVHFYKIFVRNEEKQVIILLTATQLASKFCETVPESNPT